MLVLSRKLGEKITIGDGIELTVVAVKGNRVRLGITAPESFRILRSECRPHSTQDDVIHPQPLVTAQSAPLAEMSVGRW